MMKKRQKSTKNQNWEKSQIISGKKLQIISENSDRGSKKLPEHGFEVVFKSCDMAHTLLEQKNTVACCVMPRMVMDTIMKNHKQT